MALPNTPSDALPSSDLHALESWLHNLSGQFDELREGIHQAVQVADLDPEIALTRVRKVLELVIREVFEHRIHEKPGTRPLENLTDRLRKDGFLPDRIEAYATSVRKLGNVGTHAFGERVTRDDVFRSLGHLLPVLEWYFESEHQQRPAAMSPSPASLAAATEDVARAVSGMSTRPSVRSWFSRLPIAGCSLTLTLAIFLCALTLGAAIKWNWFGHQPPRTQDDITVPEPPTRARLQLQLFLQAQKRNQDSLVSLETTNVLPLQAGDALHIEVHTERPAYLYLLNLDATGKVWPMYPWRHDDWDDVPDEKPRDVLCIPEPATASILAAGPSGIESVVVLARETPLTVAERKQLRQLLARWPVEQRTFDPLRAAVTIGEDEFRFADERDGIERGHIKVDDTVEASDPVLRLRRLLQTHVRKLGVASRGVCYPFQDK